MTQGYFLTSERLGFREWSESDLPSAKRLWGNRQVTSFIDARGQLSENQVREKLSNELAAAHHCSLQYWPIFQLLSGAFVGCCGLRPYPERPDTLEIGFHICEEYWRNGYATEAAAAVMDYAFRKLAVGALFAGHHPKNEASRGLLDKLGFIYTHDAFYEPTGLNHPSYLLTREAYLVKPQIDV